METMNVVDARRNFSEVMARVAYRRERVVIERKGALISMEDLHRLEALERDAEDARTRRAAALAAAAAARAAIRAERGGVPLPDSGDTLGRQRAPEAIGGLVAALGDEDEQLRWLAALSLQGIGGGTVIATLRAFMDQAPSDVAREEVERVLGKLTEPNG